MTLPNCGAAGSRSFAGTGAVGAWVERAIADAPNRAALQRRVESIDGAGSLLRFFHRFVLFNDALAARVPFLAGAIHLTTGLFIDSEADEEFCSQANGRVAALVAEAAVDEYRISDGEYLVHQYLSQKFFHGILDYCGLTGPEFDRQAPVPVELRRMLDEARSIFLCDRTDEEIFRALGFHVGLEFFADQEFNLIDSWLRLSQPGLVQSLERETASGSAYQWLAIHTAVEIGHYRAGLAALEQALAYYHRPDKAPQMLAHIQAGFARFVDLQKRYYEAILCDVA